MEQPEFTRRLSRRVLAATLVAVLAVTVGVWLNQVEPNVLIAQDRTATDVESIEHAKSLSHAFRSAAHSAMPTVVTIETRSAPRRLQQRAPQQENPFEGTPFEEFFKDFEDRGGRQIPFNVPQRQLPRREGMGSGVIVDPSGIILTNNHVVSGADEVIVRLSDDREFKATEIKTDEQSDLAVVRIEGAGTLPAARLGDSDVLDIGDWVIAVGNPFGLNLTVSAGIISGKGRELGEGQRTSFLQTDAAINPGNSGGPLLNLDGEVIGINTAIATETGGYQGVGFAIPSNLASWVMQHLIEHGKVQRAYLGVAIGSLDNGLAEQFGVSPGAGVLVSEVYADSPAAAAGIQPGDIITAFDGHAVHSPRDLQSVVERAGINENHDMSVLRDKKMVSLSVTPEVLPEDLGALRGGGRERRSPRGSGEGDSYVNEDLGITATNSTEEMTSRLGLGDYQGALITAVEPGSIADLGGLSPGMLILMVDTTPVENIDQLEAAMADQSLADGVLLLTRSTLGNRYVVLKKE